MKRKNLLTSLTLASALFALGGQEQATLAANLSPATPLGPAGLMADPGAEAAPAPLAEPDAATRARVSEAYGKLPLSFEVNQGQSDPQVKFLSRGSGYTLFLTSSEAVLALRAPATPGTQPEMSTSPTTANMRDSGTTQQAVLRMQLVGANPAPQVVGVDQLPGKSNYFIGNDPEKWHTDVPTYARVKYQEVYPGVDLVYYGNQRQLEYDFVVTPGADHKAIRLAFQGADKLELDTQGNLILHTPGGEVIQHAPVIYQENNDVKQAIPGHYVLQGKDRVGFEVAAYDASRPLIIDPMLVYSTFLGGSGFDWAWAIAVDSQGSAYVTGETGSSSPWWTAATNSYDRTFNGGTASGAWFPNGTDVFVTKLNPQGNTVAYSTFLGGSGNERGLGIALDGVGLAYVTGWTNSTNNFPTTSGVFDTSHNGGYDGFVTKLSADGRTLGYSTFLGGSGDDYAEGIAINSQGIAYVGGYTRSMMNFPTTSGAFDTSHNGGYDGFVTKLSADGRTLGYSTFLGGSGDDYISDVTQESDLAYVTGWTWSMNAPNASGAFPTTKGAYDRTHDGGSDVFVTKLNALGNMLGYSTLIGGSSNETGIALFVGNQVVSITGNTQSSTFPTTPGAYDTSFNMGSHGDAFVTRLNGPGSSLIYSTFLGGSDNEAGGDIVIDSAGFTYVAGHSNSSNFPLMNPIPSPNRGMYDAFVVKGAFNGQGAADIAFSTVLGGGDNDAGFGIGLDGVGIIYVAGYSWSGNFPTIPGSFDTSHNGGTSDAVVFKLAP